MIYAIGDIHGRDDYLEELLTKVPYTDDDVLIFLGDYIDRGKDSYAVIEGLIQLKNKHENTIFLKGNHELFLERCLTKPEFGDCRLWFINGGIETVESYQHNGYGLQSWLNMPNSHAKFFMELLPYYETDDYLFVHGGVDPKVFPETPIDECDEEDMLWIRFEFLFSEKNFEKIIVVGHTPYNNVIIEPNKIIVDTGSGKTGFLSCLSLPEKKVYCVGTGATDEIITMEEHLKRIDFEKRIAPYTQKTDWEDYIGGAKKKLSKADIERSQDIK